MTNRDTGARCWPRTTRIFRYCICMVALLATLRPFPAGAQDVLGPYESLYSDQARTSGNGRHTLYFQSDGNLVLARDGAIVWATGTWAPNGRVDMQGDGNLVIYDDAWNV